eukprot:s2644_g6.t1
MVSTRHARADQLRYCVHHAGRLLHVRIPHGNTHVDVVNWYQYAVNQQEGTFEKRQKLLIKLQKCLAHLPRRNSLVLGGDFNCPCEQHANVCGPAHLPPNPLHYTDYSDHQQVWRTLHLTALNTWTRPQHGQIATFVFEGNENLIQSQIDFIMIRSQHCTPRSKKAGIIETFPVAGWRTGAKHLPVRAEVPLPRAHWTPRPQTEKLVHIDQDNLIVDLRQQRPTPTLQALRDEVRIRLTSSTDPINDSSNILNEVAQRYYPSRMSPAAAPTQPEALANCARTMWGLFRRMRAQRFSAAGVFTAWRTWTQYMQAHRIHKARAKARSKQRKQDLLQQAQIAAAKQDARELYKIIKQLAPRAPKKQLQLYRGGHMIPIEEEMSWILEAYGERYGEQTVEDAVGFDLEVHTGINLAADDIEHHLNQLRPRKAVPKGDAPAVLWKACSSILAGPVAAQLQATWGSSCPQVPQRWADADVALLPKAHGRSASPLDWRPIGVQAPLGKCVMSSLIGHAKQAIVALIRRYPQSAYIPGRSTGTALCQVYEHCYQVREECAQVRINIHQQHQGQARAGESGGLQLSLDLTAAFDNIQWSDVQRALHFAGVNMAVQDILLRWLSQVRYLFRHKHMRGYVHPKWGLRQGCTGSPILWAAVTVTALLCATIDAQIHEGWVRSHLTLYADDSHLRWRFKSWAEFENLMNELRIVFACFRKFHLRINLEKTKAILKIMGHMKHRVLKHYVRRTPTGRRLLLMPGDPSQWISLVSQAEYLGLIISYDHFEQQALRHRIQKANGRRWALASILHSPKVSISYKLHFEQQALRHRIQKANGRRWALASILHSPKVSISYKLSVWRSCVYSTMMYGLSACGLNGDQARELQRAIMKHVRAIVNNQAHLTGDTHETIVNKYNIPKADVDLQQELLRAAERQKAMLDWMYDDQWQEHLCCRLQQYSEGPTRDDSSETFQWACPFCSEMFSTQAALKIHAQRTHKHIDKNDIVFNKALHSVGGLPTCRFCHKKFSRWQTLAQHITANRCTKHVPQQPTQPGDPDVTYAHMPDGPARSAIPVHEGKELSSSAQDSPITRHKADTDTDVVSQRQEAIAAAKQGLNSFIRVPVITNCLMQTCALCGQWVASHRTMKRHYQNEPESELDQFFGEVKVEGGASKRRRPQSGHHESQEQIQLSGPEPRGHSSLLISLARQVIRQEEELKVLRQDHALIYFMKPGEHTMLSHLYRTAQQFLKKQSENPHWAPGQHPLKAIMAVAVFSELGARLERACKEEDFSLKIKELGWRDPAVGWRFQYWDNAVKHLVEDKSRKPLTDQEVAAHLQKLAKLLLIPDLVHRLGCKRRLSETMEGTATFLMDLSTRTPQSLEAWNSLLALQGCTVLQLGGIAYRKESFKPSPGIAKIKEMIRSR